MSDQLGAAYVSVTLDSADMEAKVERAKGKLSELGTAAQSSFNSATVTGKSATLAFQKYAETIGMSKDQLRQFHAMLRGAPTKPLEEIAAKIRATREELQKATDAARKQAQADDFVNSLKQQSAAIGKTRVDLLELKAAELGVADSVKPFIAQLRAQERALESSSRAVNQYGLSQKQQVAAMRQVPAQITDIFTSLQGGQNPLTVLIQQGGQLKDVFGGIRPAAAALTSQLAGMVNPLTVAAGLTVAIGAAWMSASLRAEGFNKALILSGNAARVSAGDLQRISESLDNVGGVTSRQAASALVELVNAGKIAVDQYEKIAQAAVLMQDVTGKATKETFAEYAELARDPVNAVLRLNDAENFLTNALYQRIRALQEAGDIEGAAAIASAARADSQIQKAAEFRESLGLVTGAWHDIKNATGEAWDEATNYFTQLDREAKEGANTLRNLWASFKTGGMGAAFGIQATLFGGAQQAMAPVTAAATAAGRISSEIQKQVDALEAGNRTRVERQALEEKQIVNLYRQLGVSEKDKRVQDALAASRRSYADSAPKPPKAKAEKSTRAADLRADLQDFKDAMAEERAEVANNSRLVQAQFAAKLISASDYYDKMREFAARDAAAQSTGLEQQIAVLRGRNATGVEAINIARQIGTLESQLGQIRAKLAVDTQLLNIAEKSANDERLAAQAAYKASIDQATESVKAAFAAQYSRVTQSDREYEKGQKLVEVNKRLADELRRLAAEYARTRDAAAYEANVEAARAGAQAQREAIEEGYRGLDEVQANWLNGARTGLNNWMDAARNVAGQVSAMTTRLLDGTVDMLTTYATTGKLAWREMLVDMGKQIVAFMMKQAVLKFLEAFGVGNKDGNTGGGGIWSNILGAVAGAFTKNATGNVYQSPSLSAYSNTLHNTPQTFAFAKGAGVFGEAGWEAIMPLTRGPDGNLGVRTSSGGGGGGVNMSMQFVINGDGTTTRKDAGDAQGDMRRLGMEVGTMVEARLQRHMLPGGLLWKAGVGVAG